jgi:hypothetical protein
MFLSAECREANYDVVVVLIGVKTEKYGGEYVAGGVALGAYVRTLVLVMIFFSLHYIYLVINGP